MLVPPGETIVETKSCKSCGVSFVVTDKDMEFYDRVSPVFAGVKCAMPPPTRCPDCRRLRRLSFENHRALYRRACDLTGRPTVSMHHPGKPMKVYDYEAWWSDAWDPLSYGREFDFTRTFAEQYSELRRDVPAIGMSRMNSENSDYCNQAWYLKDCYLCFNADVARDCYYCSSVQHCTDCLDSHALRECERCRYSTDLERCSDCSYCSYSRDCSSSSHLFDCVGCTDCSYCFASSGLRGQSYYAHGEPVSPAEYGELLRRYREEKFDSNRRSEDLAECERVSDSARSWRVSDSVGVEDCRYCSNITDAKDAYDIDYYGLGIELAYDSAAVGGRYAASGFCENIGGDTARLWYCVSCMNGVQDCFGCTGLRNARYCILNKQYTEAEYNALVPRIIEHMRRTGEWGEFSPSSVSPFGYNETVAMERLPLTREEALRRGFRWSDYEAPFPAVSKIIPANKLPENIKDIPDDILNWAIECEITKKPYRIIKQELDVYRKYGLPVPRRHPDRRHLDRLAERTL